MAVLHTRGIRLALCMAALLFAVSAEDGDEVGDSVFVQLGAGTNVAAPSSPPNATASATPSATASATPSATAAPSASSAPAAPSKNGTAGNNDTTPSLPPPLPKVSSAPEKHHFGPASALFGPKIDCVKSPVVVIGAGISGLYAARELKRGGCNVTVLEARSRVGGRIQTDPATGAELGAHWLEGITGNAAAGLAQDMGLEVVSTGGVAGSTPVRPNHVRVFTGDGAVVNASKVQLSFDKVDAIDDQLMKRYVKHVNLPDGLRDESVEEALDKIEYDAHSPTMRALLDWQIRVNFPLEYGAETSEVSLASHARMDSRGGGDGYVREGFSALVERLADGLDVRFEHIVTRVRYSDSGVTVSTATHGQVSGCIALVTVPLGVLKNKRITFDPELSERKRSAIDSLEMGLLNVVHLTFRDPWWSRADPSHYAFGYLGNVEGGHSKEHDWDQFFSIDWEGRPATAAAGKGGAPHVLSFYNGGKGAKMYEAKTKEQVRDHVMGILRKVAGAVNHTTQVPEPIAVNVTEWGKDQFSYGSYSYTPVGVDDDVRTDLAESAGDRVFFAGEATSLHNYQSVDGALVSGYREADRILTLLGRGRAKLPSGTAGISDDGFEGPTWGDLTRTLPIVVVGFALAGLGAFAVFTVADKYKGTANSARYQPVSQTEDIDDGVSSV